MFNQGDVDDLEAFMDGLKEALDSLENVDLSTSKGFQARFASAISQLREKKKEMVIFSQEYHTKEDLKLILLEKLSELTSQIDSKDYQHMTRFELLMSIAKLRARIKRL